MDHVSTRMDLTTVFVMERDMEGSIVRKTSMNAKKPRVYIMEYATILQARLHATVLELDTKGVFVNMTLTSARNTSASKIRLVSTHKVVTNAIALVDSQASIAMLI